MTTPVEDPAVTTPAASQTSRKMLQLLRKRLRQLLWATLGLAVAGGILAIWWLASLNGLPDIGDPFDVAELRAFKIPDDQNAFTFFRRAQGKLTPRPDLPRSATSVMATVAWSQADPKLREWVEANRIALELFQQGANLSDGISRPAGEPYTREHNYFNPNALAQLALLEGGRRAEGGDPAGAWDCYRSVLRAATHLRRRGDPMARFVANTLHSSLRQRLSTWAADPRTTIPQLRRAMDEVVESQPRPEWSAFSLKIFYFDTMRYLDRPVDYIHRALDERITYHLGGFEVPTELTLHLYGVHRFLKREPERSRRVLRLLFANWLAHVEVPELRQTRPVVRALFSSSNQNTSVLLSPISPKAPAGARVLSPQQVATWLFTTLDLKDIISGDMRFLSVHTQELRNYRELVLLLAEELYHRERGVLPASEQDLVGTYLKTLPDDGSAELDDGTVPIVSDSRTAAATPPR